MLSNFYVNGHFDDSMVPKHDMYIQSLVSNSIKVYEFMSLICFKRVY